MNLWFDAHLSPQIAHWAEQTFNVACSDFDALGYRLAADGAVFAAARARGDVVIVTKDDDYRRVLDRLGPPPAIIWLTCGNTSNTALKALFARRLPAALALIEAGEPLVEIS